MNSNQAPIAAYAPRQTLLGCFVWLHLLICLTLLVNQIFRLGLLSGDPTWRATLFFAYISGCAVYGVAFALIKLGILSPLRPTVDPRTIRTSALLRHRKFLSNRLRAVGAEILDWVRSALYWPIQWFYGAVLTGGSVRAFQEIPELAVADAQRRKARAELTLAFAALCLTLLAWLSVSSPGPRHAYARTVLGLMGIALAGRHLFYLVSTVHPIADMRRTLRHPYLGFLALVFMDFISIVLAAGSYFKDLTRNSSFSSYLDVSQDIFQGRRLFSDLLSDRVLPDTAGAISALIGVLLYFSAFKLLPYKKERFARSSQDQMELAMLEIEAGRPQEALKRIDQIGSGTFESMVTCSIVFLANGGTGRAVEMFQRLLLLRNLPYYKEDILVWATAVCSASRIPGVHKHGAFEWGIRERTADWSSWLFLCMAASSDTQVQDLCLRTLEEDTAVGRCYPLTHAEILVRQGRRVEGMTLLQEATPGLEVEEVLRILLLLQWRLTATGVPSTAASGILRDWIVSEEKSTVSELLQLTWDRPFYFQAGILALSTLRRLAEDLGVDTAAEEVKALIASLKARAPRDHSVQWMMESIDFSIQQGAPF